MTLDESIKRYTDNAEYERMHGNLQGCLDFRQLAEWLSELEQLRERARWIPVSEKLPEDGDVVLATFQPHYPSNLLFGGNHVVEVTFSLISNVWKNGTVLAWMPLPEPYKAESEVAK